MNELVDITGQSFGAWQVIGYAGNQKWRCVCSCGAERDRDGRSLRSGRSRSCLRCSQMAKPHRQTHGGRWTRLYNIWSGMKRRCMTISDAAYPRYGGRGITVCKEWSESFEAFRDWALGNGYAEKLTIDRKKNNLGYSPENCRWATHAEQNRNYSRNVVVEFRGEKVNVVDLAERFGIKRYTLWQRIMRHHLTAEAAVALGSPKPEMISVNGQQEPLSLACESAGLSIVMVRKRLRRGWEPERSLRP